LRSNEPQEKSGAFGKKAEPIGKRTSAIHDQEQYTEGWYAVAKCNADGQQQPFAMYWDGLDASDFNNVTLLEPSGSAKHAFETAKRFLSDWQSAKQCESK
jgi:hypothetical protein